MPEILIILSPPRSFSSVVSTVIGQHPEMYGFPELHLFAGDTVEEVLTYEGRRGKPQGPPGLLRTLAELHDGTQTTATVIKARAWLDERLDWSVQKLFDYLLEQIDIKLGSKIVVEKSPVTVMRPRFIERAYSLFPDAYYLHLTRHPITARASMQEFGERKQKLKTEPETGLLVDPIRMWLYTHKNIINFTNTLPLGQSMRVKGEEVLSEPDVYLAQIADWLGLRTDAEAIDGMKHPENSPYASLGPLGARGGNDGKFMLKPALRGGKVSEPSLKESLEKKEFKWASEEDFVRRLVNLSQQIGYQ